MNVPKLRFKNAEGADFPLWTMSKLGNEVQFSKGGKLGKSDLQKEGSHQCLLYGELYTSYGSIASKIFSRTDTDSDTTSQKYDVVMPTSGETAEDIATATCIPFDGILYGGDLIILRSQTLYGPFLSYQINSSLKRKISRVAQGKSVVHIGAEKIKPISFSFPCLEEQQKIASFFSTLDQKIELNERKIEALERLKKGLLKKIFSQELRFRDKNGRDFPLWNEVVLSSISGKITVGIANSATHAYTKRGIALIRNTNIKPNYLDETDIAHITQDFAKKYESKKLKADDILICRTGYPGTACLVPKKYEGAQTFTTLIVRIDKSYALPAYVCQYINSDRGKEYLNKTSIGGGQKNSGAGIIKDLLIPIPCIDEQYAILEILQSLDNKISIITTKLDSIKRLKQGFMQQMFI